MNNRKVVKKLFLPSQYEKEEQFLEAMSSQGWRLIDVSNNLMTRYEFEKFEEKKLAYHIEYIPKENEEKHIENIKKSSWSEATNVEGTYGKWHYYFSEKGLDDNLIINKSEKLDSLNRIILSYGDLYMLLLTIQIITISSCINCMQYGTFRKYLSIGILIFSLLVSGVIIFDIIKLITSRNSLEKEMVQGEI